MAPAQTKENSPKPEECKRIPNGVYFWPCCCYLCLIYGIAFVFSMSISKQRSIFMGGCLENRKCYTGRTKKQVIQKVYESTFVNGFVNGFIRPNRRTDLNMHPKVQKNVLELGSLYSDVSLWFCLDFLAVMLRGQPFLTLISRCISLAALVNVIIMCPLCTVECLARRPSRLLKPSSPVNGLLHPS